MNKKLLLICLALVAIVCFSSTVSAGWFDWGEEEVQNKTVTFETGCSLDLPEGSSVVNMSESGNVETAIHIITNNVTGQTYRFEIVTGSNIVVSTDEYYSNSLDYYPNITDEGKYNNKWTIFDLHNDGMQGDNAPRYELFYHSGSALYILKGADLQALKDVADTFKE